MKSVDDTQTEMTTAKVHQVPVISDEEKTTSDFARTQFPIDNNVETLGTKAGDDYHPVEPVLLPNGKPLKGILKHRCHTDAKAHTSSERIVAVLEGGAESSVSNKLELSEKLTTNDRTTDDESSEPVTPPHSGTY